MPTTARMVVTAREVLGADGGHYGAVCAPDGVGGARDSAVSAHHGAT